MTLALKLDGLTCASCVARAETALRDLSSVDDATVNLATGTAQVTGDHIDPDAVIATLKTAGYPALTETVDLNIDAMSCASCIGRVERQITGQPGVLGAEVNLATQQGKVTALAGSGGVEAAIAALTQAGYPARRAAPATDRETARDGEAMTLRRAALIAGLLTLPVFILEMGSHMIPAFHHWVMANLGMQTSRVIQFILTTAVLAGPGRVFLSRGFPALFKGTPDMNSLVAIGTSAAWSFSVVATFAPSLLPEGGNAVYFEAAAVIVTLILLGRWLEARAKGKTGAAIARLVQLAPKSAEVERDGVVSSIPLDQILTGDVIHIRPGERIAVDGTVTDGKSFIDESMITGEPVPVAKGPGDTVIGGTINGRGALRFTATKVGRDTMLSQIIRMVEEAQGARLPIQALVNQVTAWFVPAVLVVAAITVAVWLIFGPSLGAALVAAVAVLIIACPCAMGLATPTSIMVGTGRAAELGVLFRKGDALQSLSQVSIVAFDKTGTLTLGRPELTTFETAEGLDADTVLARVAAVEALSEHPIAAALTRAARDSGMTLPEVTGFEAVTGMGVTADVAGHAILIGADRLMARSGIETGALAKVAGRIAAEGQTPIFVALDGAIAAVLGVSDPVKPGAAHAIAALHEMGIKTAMITGDTAQTARSIAARLGIDHVVAGVMPQGKVTALNALRGDGQRLAFVGDGINDAPALAHADVGIAMGTGTDVAIDAADVVLTSGALDAVGRAFAISRATMRNIRQNLGWAFGYNTLLIPVAAGVFYPLWGLLLSPALAAAAMALSSVAVVTNALRLRHAAGADATGALPNPVPNLQSAT
ncbi:heavy metal translocating P-type ATPase [Aestuariivita sp.]|uniref:heavy metal translocating P-type ATPase n=1 Tax=Aestuariivita sp. TaxID=1872407 RepID=UPI002171F0A9|nr:heavy metal translocating P-type ATPase [Aestuariivita sp.]MCE8006020.1 copper-translocating P-type ATPase [Aestuariivita sp.]